jgi:hypothetical protein
MCNAIHRGGMLRRSFDCINLELVAKNIGNEFILAQCNIGKGKKFKNLE